MSRKLLKHGSIAPPSRQHKKIKLESDAYPPVLDYWNNNTYFSPEKEWNAETIEKALQNGLDPDVLWNKEDLVSSEGAYDEKAWRHWNTPLHLAMRCSDHDSAKLILRQGGDVNIQNDLGHTPLHEAIDHQRPNNIWFLIRHGADPDKSSRDGHVPLHLALRDGDEELFCDLLQNGATLGAAAYFQWSIVDLALLALERGILARLLSDEHGLLPTPMFTHSQASDQPHLSAFSAAAGRLLAITLSNRILPSEALYKTYEALLLYLDLPTNRPWDVEAVDNLIEGFVAGLYKASNTPRLTCGEQFCPSCLEFQSIAGRSCRGPITGMDRYSGRVEIHKNKAELEGCALKGCPLCALVADWLYEKPEGSRAHVTDDGKTQWRDIVDESCLHPESSPITLEVRATLVVPFGELPQRIDSVHARLAHAHATSISFDLNGLDVRFGRQDFSSSHINNTGSPHAMSVARQWLQTCRTSPAHSHCHTAYRNISRGPVSPLPTRVLHVGSDCQDPYLFESNGLRASYCILSYCWGCPGNAITTKANILERTKGLALTYLPTLIQEAVLTARALRFEYIWIDALCIIQDDEADWAAEASVMHDLYSRADLTITSLTAGDSRDKLFQPRPRRVCRPIPLNLGLLVPKGERPRFEEERTVELAVYPDRKLALRTAFSGPVHQRAWILQEQIMSTRLLYFGAGLLHWECLHNYVLESDPSAQRDQGTNSDFYKYRKRKSVIKGVPAGKDVGPGDLDPFKVWQALVSEYTSRKMTKPSDRIPAFLAICNSTMMLLKDEFVGGIWKSDNYLLESMCWRLLQPDTADPRGPTWTWASRSGEVSYDCLEHDGDKTRRASIIACDASTDRSQRRVFGSIRLKGTLTLMQDDFVMGAGNSLGPYDHISRGTAYGCAFDMIAFDKSPPRPMPRTIPYMSICPRPRAGEEGGIVRLLLQPVNENEDFETVSTFKRVGIEFYSSKRYDAVYVPLTPTVDWMKKNRCYIPLGTAVMVEPEDKEMHEYLRSTTGARASQVLPEPSVSIDGYTSSAIENTAQLERPPFNDTNDDGPVPPTVWATMVKKVSINRTITII